MIIMQEAICTFSFSPHIDKGSPADKPVTCLRGFFFAGKKAAAFFPKGIAPAAARVGIRAYKTNPCEARLLILTLCSSLFHADRFAGSAWKPEGAQNSRLSA